VTRDTPHLAVDSFVWTRTCLCSIGAAPPGHVSSKNVVGGAKKPHEKRIVPRF
jgi:hypothetical protein